MKHKLLAGLFILFSLNVLPQKVTVVSPNNRVSIELFNTRNTDAGEWFLKVNYFNADKNTIAIPRIKPGLSRSDQDFVRRSKR